MNSEKHHHGNADQISPLPASEYQGILRNKLSIDNQYHLIMHY